MPADYEIPSVRVLSKAGNPLWEPQLFDVLNSDDFKKSDVAFPLPLGIDERGKLNIVDLTAVGNVIVVGNPQSRKEIFIDTLLITLLLKCSPTNLRLLLCDEGQYLNLYNGIPHLLAPVMSTADKTGSAYQWVLREMENRILRFQMAGERSFETYNKKIESRGDKPLPLILVVGFLVSPDKEIKDTLTRVTAIGARTGILNVLVVNRAHEDNLSSSVKANIPARVVFKLTSAGESRTAGVTGAERLDPGKVIYKPNSGNQIELQAIYTTEKNVKEVVDAVSRAAL